MAIPTNTERVKCAQPGCNNPAELTCEGRCGQSYCSAHISPSTGKCNNCAADTEKPASPRRR
jgi:uncharacterized low-complexity protein